MECLDKLIQKEQVTYQRLEAMYNKCKASLDELEKVFQDKRDLSNSKDMEMVLNLQTISNDIQSLSQRIVKLERKIENVSRTMLKGGNERDADNPARQSPSPCPTDRKLLPNQRKEKSPSLTISSVSSGTPLIIPESSCQSGGSSSNCPSKKTKEVSWSEQSARRQRKREDKRKSPVRQKRGKEDEKRTTPPVLEKESYEKVSKLIPELLTKFQEFHQSLNRDPKRIEGETAVNILRVMRILEGLETRLARAGKDDKEAVGCLDVKMGSN